MPRVRTGEVWCERWRSLPDRLARLEANVRSQSMAVLPGGDYDRWDLEARAGQLGGARIRLAAEEHGDGRQMVRYRMWPTVSRGGATTASLLLALAGFAYGVGREGAAIALVSCAGLIALRTVHECAAATRSLATAASTGEADE